MNQDLIDKVNGLKEAMGKVIVGQEKAVQLLLTAIIANGHVLLEGVPGVAKTLTAKYMSKLMGTQYGRIQFTPDLMPSDILGTEVYEQHSASFSFHPGPVFVQTVLADEINRAPAKTQAALFEVMEERQVTIAGKTYKMSPMFTIIATQNPIEQEGTYRLPEAQLDRFICKIVMDYPSPEQEMEILRRHDSDSNFTALADIEPVITPEEMIRLREMATEVVVDQSLMRYIVNITALSRQSNMIALPASPRAAVYMMNMAKAYAVMQGRDFATPDDVRYVAEPVLRHRIQLSTEAEMEGRNINAEIERLLSTASAELGK